MNATSSNQRLTSRPGQPRDQWHTQCDFILSCIGKTVGLGNIWRFPYMSLRYGGITFLVPYLILLVVMGVPLYVLELTLGQYSGAGPRQVFRRISPLFSGVGTAMLLVLAFTVFTYNLAVAWTVFFAGASIMEKLPWGRCGENYNTANCFAMAGNGASLEAEDDEDIFSNNTFASGQWLPEEHMSSAGNWNASNCAGLPTHPVDRHVSSSEEYFFNHVLGLRGDSLRGLGTLRWDIAICMLTAWLLVAACISRGITAVGRILHFTVIFPYFALVLLMIPTAYYDGVHNGIRFYGIFNASLLLNPDLWSDAASQLFFSLGISHGDIIALASFSRLRNNCMRDAIIVAVVNTLTSVFSVLVVYGMLGVAARRLGREVGNVHGLGLGLAFVTYPEALLYTPNPLVFSALFFIMLITLGLDSQFIMVEMLAVAVVDEWPALRPHRRWVSAGVCVLFFAANLCLCLDGGVRVFALVDHYAFSFSQFAVALLEVVAVAWVFGATRLLGLMRHDMAIPMPKAVQLYWRLTWRYAVPVILLAVLGTSVASHRRATFTAGQTVLKFNWWEDGIGLVLMLAPALLVLLVAVVVAVRQRHSGGSLKEVVSPTEDWGPAKRAEREPIRSSEAGQSAVVSGDQCRMCNVYLATLRPPCFFGTDAELPVRHSTDMELQAYPVRGVGMGSSRMRGLGGRQTEMSSPERVGDERNESSYTDSPVNQAARAPLTDAVCISGGKNISPTHKRCNRKPKDGRSKDHPDGFHSNTSSKSNQAHRPLNGVNNAGFQNIE